MPARKLAETDAQIQTLHHHVLAQCVAITSSIATIPPEIILDEMRGSTFHAMYSSSPLRWRGAIAEVWPLTAVRAPGGPWRA